MRVLTIRQYRAAMVGGDLDVPTGIWAVFERVGPFPETLQNIWGRIYAEWFPGANYELAEGPEILWNENKEIDSPEFRSEIWIPVVKKSR